MIWVSSTLLALPDALLVGKFDRTFGLKTGLLAGFSSADINNERIGVNDEAELLKKGSMK